MRDCPTISARGRDTNQVTPNVPDGGATKRNHFYVIKSKANSGKDAGKL